MSLAQSLLLNEVKKDINNFKKKVDSYCSSNGQGASISYFLTNKKEGALYPENINVLLSGNFSRYLLFNSKSFHHLLRDCDRDTQKQILRGSELLKIRLKTKTNKNLLDFIKKELGEDFLN